MILKCNTRARIGGVLLLAAPLLPAGSFARSAEAEPHVLRVDAGHVVATVNRAHLLGINIAVYNQPDDYRRAIEGPVGDLHVGLIRVPGGSVSDRFYWNGHGVLTETGADPSRFADGFWQVDFSDYRPGFVVDMHDWSKIDPGFSRLDAQAMHELTRRHPLARNLVTVNAGTGTPELAAEWVRWANVVNDYDVTYWEIGNELNGEWEAGHIRPDGSRMTAEEYARIFTTFAKAMKAVDPSIRVGGPSCDIRHHEDYFEPLLRDAGEHVDFLTLHYYSLRNSLAPEEELFEGLFSLKPVTERLHGLLEKYQPDRKEDIELSITEWNSKLPKDDDAYRLFNGLWFSAWFGEMIKAGIDSATVWDMFSGADNGHGLLVQQDREYVPTGRYWAFWLWSHYMADTLVATTAPGSTALNAYATRDEGTLNIMVVNSSRTEAYPVTLLVEGFDASPRGREVTLSSREYFWDPYAGRADWNTGPLVNDLSVGTTMNVVIPPYCVKVFQFKADGPDQATPTPVPGEARPESTLALLLPDQGQDDLAVEGWVRVFEEGTTRPHPEDPGTVHLSVEGPANLSTPELPLAGAAARFVLIPTGSGTATVTAVSGDLTATHTVRFEPVALEKRIVWDFSSPLLEQPAVSHYTFEASRFEPAGRDALRITLPGVVVKEPSNHVFALEALPEEVPRERIGGVVFDVLVPEDFEVDDPGANLQVVLQSHGAYWIPCGIVHLRDVRDGWRTISFEIPDKRFLKVMDQTFSIRFLMATHAPASGSVYLDNIGFLLRPE